MTYAVMVMVVVAALGCGNSSSGSGKASVTVKVYDPDLAGVTVVFDGQRKVFDAGGGSELTNTSFMVATLPAAAPTMELEYETPCGVRKIPATTREDWRGKDQLKLMLSIGESASPTRRKVYIDAPEGVDVTIGKASVTSGWVRDLGCAARHDVAVGGKTVGTLEGALDESVFITSQADACYRFAAVAYGETLHGSGERVLRGQQVHRFAGTVQYFLEDVPESIRTSGTSEGMTLTQLQRLPSCP